MRKKIAIINQRYGLEVNGGSEYYTRLIAERLNRNYQVEVLTTQALDYDTWQNFYKEKTEYINDVCVRRFPVRRKRNSKAFRIVNKITRMFGKYVPVLEKWWVKKQGPYSPDLVQYIKMNKDEYDLFIFVTYLYYPTYKGISEVGRKSILIPTAHDEPYIYFKSYKKVFEEAGGYIFLTQEEKDFIEKQFKRETEGKYSRVLGAGIEIPEVLLSAGEKTEEECRDWRAEYKLTDPYFIYVGRVDYGKNCDELFRYFMKYIRDRSPVFQNSCKLVVIGKAQMPVPVHPDIIYLGYVEERVKYAAIASARSLILPSKYESLSISVLEAMALAVPVIVNGSCEVLKGHCLKSNAGLYYNNYEEFKTACDFMNHEGDSHEYREMKSNGKKYVEHNYRWELIDQGLTEAIERVTVRK